MTTIRLDVNNKAINKVMQFLKAFDSDEVIIINKDQNYLSEQKYLQQELEDINSGKAQIVSHNELDSSLNEIIAKYGDSL